MSLDEWVYRNYTKIYDKVFKTLYKEYREKNIKELKEVAKLVSRWPKELKQGSLIQKIGSIFDRNPETAKLAAKEAEKWELKAEDYRKVLDSILYITGKGEGNEDVSAYLAENTGKLLKGYGPEGYEELVKKVIGEFTYNKTFHATPTVGKKLLKAILNRVDGFENESNKEKFRKWLPKVYKELRRTVRKKELSQVDYILSPPDDMPPFPKKIVRQYKMDKFMGGSK